MSQINLLVLFIHSWQQNNSQQMYTIFL